MGRWSRVTLNDVADGCRKALTNAQDLLADAALLFDAGRFPRAFALAQVAQEELAKIPMLYRAGSEIHAGHPVDWDRLGRRFRSHKHKSWAGAITEFAHGPGDETVKERIERLKEAIAATPEQLRRKEQALYVDINAGGFVAPSEVITQEEASDLIRRVQANADFYAQTLPDNLAGFAREMTDEERRVLDMTHALLRDSSEESFLNISAMLRRAGVRVRDAVRDREHDGGDDPA